MFIFINTTIDLAYHSFKRTIIDQHGFGNTSNDWVAELIALTFPLLFFGDKFEALYFGTCKLVIGSTSIHQSANSLSIVLHIDMH